MSERDSAARTAVVTYFPMVIAVLSLFTAIYNGHLNNRFVSIIQGNVGRLEYMRTCKEIIDAYFQVKFRTGIVGAAAERTGLSRDLIEAENAVAKFAALGTYLANLRDEVIRARYTQLSRELEAVVHKVAQSGAVDDATRFQAADLLFAELNADCVRSAKDAPL
jgi:hypothetical protein